MWGLQQNFWLGGSDAIKFMTPKCYFFPVFTYDGWIQLNIFCIYSLSYFVPRVFWPVRIVSDWAFLISKFVQRWLFWGQEHFFTHPLHYSLFESQRRSRHYFTQTYLTFLCGANKALSEGWCQFCHFPSVSRLLLLSLKILLFLKIHQQHGKINLYVHSTRQI